MDKEWIPVITTAIAVVATLLGVAITGGLNTLLKYFELNNQKEIESNKVMQGKMEELHDLLMDYQTEIILWKRKIIQVDNDGLEKYIIAQNIESSLDYLTKPLKRISTLTNIYFPSLDNDCNELASKLSMLPHSAISYKFNGKDDTKELDHDVQSILDITTKLMQQLSSLSHHYVPSNIKQIEKPSIWKKLKG